MAELRAYIERKGRELQRTEQIIHLREDFNLRQMALISHALGHPDALYTIAEHQASHKVVYETARSDLLSLARMGLLQTSRRGREYFFRPVPNFEKVLMGKGRREGGIIR